MGLLAKYIPAWFGLMALAIANGALRVKVYGPGMDELRAHQISTLIGIILFAGFMWGLMRLWPPASARQALIIGIVWLAMTVIFEFVFGHYVMGHSWSRLLADYNLFKGRVWVLVLIWTTFGPFVIYRIIQQ